MESLGKTWRRVSQMDWDERKTRFAQEFHKRLDLALSRSGLHRPPSQILNGSSPRGNFFFSPGELTNRIRFLESRMGPEVERIVQEADQICNHQFHLLGYVGLDFGQNIDWHADPVHGKRASRKPWFKIDFLNLDEVGDHKVIWELNRHQHLVTLAKAWCVTREPRYVLELQAQFYSWQKENPYPIGINWGSSLEVGFRSLSWIWVLLLLSESATEAGFRQDVIAGLALNGKYIERYLSTYFSPNTHLLGEAVALFFIGTLFSEIGSANRWREIGWRTLLKESRRQVRPDGVYFEQSLYYHVYALDFFLHARILAGKNGQAIPPEFDGVLNKMLDVLAALCQAGIAEGFGDDDGGRVFDPRRNRTEHMTDPLAIGAILFQRDDLKSAATLTEETVWMFGEQAVSFFERPEKHPRQVTPASFVDGGIYVMASSCNSPLAMAIDAGPQGTGRSGHGHADALSVTVAIGGRRWLIDSGAFCYVGTERGDFRGTRAHNTLQVDSLDQAIPDGPFAWKSIPEVHCEAWIAGKTFTLFEGSHTGYMRLSDPVAHRRCIFYLHDKFWLVHDIAAGKGKHQIEINWHFAPAVIVEQTHNVFIAKQSHHPDRESGTLVLLTVPASNWKHHLEEYAVSSAYGSKDMSTALRISQNVKLPVEHATLVVPQGSRQEVGTFSYVGKGGSNPSVYSYEDTGKKYYSIFADPQTKAWAWNGWSSDARFLYFSIEDGLVADLVFCDGREIRLNEMQVISCRNNIQRFEWNRKTGMHYSSENFVTSPISTQFLNTFSPA